MKKNNKKIDPSKLINLKKKREELAKQEEEMKAQMLADLGLLVVNSVQKNESGNIDFLPGKKEEILQIAVSLQDVI